MNSVALSLHKEILACVLDMVAANVVLNQDAPISRTGPLTNAKNTAAANAVLNLDALNLP